MANTIMCYPLDADFTIAEPESADMVERRAEGYPGDHEKRLRDVERWSDTHEEKCTGRHRAIDIRFDSVDEGIEAARQEAEKAASTARIAQQEAVAFREEAAKGRAAILSWLRGIFGSIVSTATVGLGSQTPMGQAILKMLHFIQ